MESLTRVRSGLRVELATSGCPTLWLANACAPTIVCPSCVGFRSLVMLRADGARELARALLDLSQRVAQ